MGSLLASLILMTAFATRGLYAEIEYQIPWSYQVMLGEAVTLECNDTEYTPQYGDTLQWYFEDSSGLLPEITGDHMNPDKHSLSTVDGVAAMFLTIKDVQTADHGIYRCIYGDGMVIRKSLNLGGPLYANQFDKYRHNLMIGGIAGGSMFVFFLMLIFIDRFRYREKEESQSEKEEPHQRAHPTNAYENPTFEADNEIIARDEFLEGQGSREINTKL